MEAAEITQGHWAFGQPVDRLLEVFALTQTHLGDRLVELGGDVDQHLDQESDRAARGADIGHEQHAVARRLVDLNAVPVHQLFAFERIAVITGTPDGQGDSRRVEDEFVVVPGGHHVAQSRAQRLVDGRRPEPVRDQMSGAKAIHVLAEQRMVVDCIAQLHGIFDLPLHKFGAFQRNLSATQVQRRQDLVVG